MYKTHLTHIFFAIFCLTLSSHTLAADDEILHIKPDKSISALCSLSDAQIEKLLEEQKRELEQHHERTHFFELISPIIHHHHHFKVPYSPGELDPGFLAFKAKYCAICPVVKLSFDCPANQEGRCPYLHSMFELESHPNYKTQLCKNNWSKNLCMDRHCPYAHNIDDLRASVEHVLR